MAGWQHNSCQRWLRNDGMSGRLDDKGQCCESTFGKINYVHQQGRERPLAN